MSSSQRDTTAALLFVGLSLPGAQGDAASAIRNASADGFGFVTTQISNTTDPRPDVIQLDHATWSGCIVGQLTENSTSFGLEWAHHMGLPAVLLPPIQRDQVPSYASVLLQQCLKTPSLSFQFWVPLYLTTDSLQDWETAYRMCDQNHHISAALALQPLPESSREHPANYVAKQIRLLHTALGAAPVRAVILPTQVFLTNKKGYPTLSRTHQLIVTEVLRRVGRTVRFLIQGEPRHSLSTGSAGRTRCLPYFQYVQHMRSRQEVTSVLDTEEASLESAHLDALQRPLQPLHDHLEFQTYEVFEKDPVKYKRYKDALVMAFEDRQHLPECNVFVVGAGRGPLVTCALEAYRSSRNHPPTLRIWAIEKNPSAVVYLNSKAASDDLWKACGVQVLGKDLRELRREDCKNHQCDIVVSELLGSFGDNELSPECLDAFFQSDVCKRDTVSIPKSYTAHLSLVSSAHLHSEARSRALFPNDAETGMNGMVHALETPYVVRTHMASQMHAEQDCWTFVHPHVNEDRSRYKFLDFEQHPCGGAGMGSGYGSKDDTVETAATSNPDPIPPHPWTLHGLLGTFTTELYKRHKDGQEERCLLSTAPANFSKGMYSWFPLFFPLREPVLVPAGANIRVDMWRRTDESADKVWYEWSVAVHRNRELLSATAIHNPGGRSSHMCM